MHFRLLFKTNKRTKPIVFRNNSVSSLRLPPPGKVCYRLMVMAKTKIKPSSFLYQPLRVCPRGALQWSSKLNAVTNYTNCKCNCNCSCNCIGNCTLNSKLPNAAIATNCKCVLIAIRIVCHCNNLHFQFFYNFSLFFQSKNENKTKW